MPPFVRTPYNFDRRLVSLSLSTRNTAENQSVQSDAADADINVLVRRFGVTGTIPSVPVPPSYQQFDEVFDFQSAMNVIRAAQESFDALPASTRSRFSNDPSLFVEFCGQLDSDGKLANLEEMRKMGLALPPEPDPPPVLPMKVEVVNPNVPRETLKE